MRALFRALFALVLLGLCPLLFGGNAAAAELYQRKTIAVFGDEGDPVPGFIRSAFQGLGRFDYEPIPVRHCDDLYDFLDRFQRRVEDTAADKAARELVPDAKFKEVIVDGEHLDRILRSAYALVPQGRFSNWIQFEPTVSIVDRDGQFYRKTSVSFRSHYAFRLMVYDLAAHRSIAHYATTYPLDYTISREVRISEEAAKKPQKAHLDKAFLDEITLLLIAQPRQHLLDQAHLRLRGEIPHLLKWARSLDPFILKSVILETDWDHDEVRMAFGKDAGIRTDNGYRVIRRIKREDGGFDLKDVGMIKVRRIEATMSVAQALIVDESFGPGDQLIERPRLDWNASLKLGLSPFFVPAARISMPEGPAFVQPQTLYAPTLTWANEYGLGAMTGISELYGVLDASLLLGNPLFGAQGEVGLLKKQFHRRWGWYYGGKIGILHAMASGGPATFRGIRYPSTLLYADAPGVSGIAGMNYHLTPDALFSLDLGLQAYAPTMGWSIWGQGSDRELHQWLGSYGGLPDVSATGFTLRTGFTVTF